MTGRVNSAESSAGANRIEVRLESWRFADLQNKARLIFCRHIPRTVMPFQTPCIKTLTLLDRLVLKIRLNQRYPPLKPYSSECLTFWNPSREAGFFIKKQGYCTMWKNFILILTPNSIQLEFPEVPTPLLRLLQSPDGNFIPSNKNMKWERPIDEIWVKRVSKLVEKYKTDGARIEDFRFADEEKEKVSGRLGNDSLSEEEKSISDLLYQIKQLQEEVAELKKFDAIAFEKLTQLNRVLESGQQKPKAKTQKSSKLSGRTKSSS